MSELVDRLTAFVKLYGKNFFLLIIIIIFFAAAFETESSCVPLEPETESSCVPLESEMEDVKECE